VNRRSNVGRIPGIVLRLFYFAIGMSLIFSAIVDLSRGDAYLPRGGMLFDSEHAPIRFWLLVSLRFALGILAVGQSFKRQENA